MFDELTSKGSLGFNSGRPIGVMIDNPPTPVRAPRRDWQTEHRDQLRKAGERPCVDCKFSRQVAVGNSECHKDAFESRDRITGEPITVGWSLCDTQRAYELDSHESYCGVEGRFFEPKEPK